MKEFIYAQVAILLAIALLVMNLPTHMKMNIAAFILPKDQIHVFNAQVRLNDDGTATISRK